MKNRDVSITQQPPFLQELQKPTAAKKIACFLSIFSLLTPRNARLLRTSCSRNLHPPFGYRTASQCFYPHIGAVSKVIQTCVQAPICMTLETWHLIYIILHIFMKNVKKESETLKSLTLLLYIFTVRFQNQ